MNQEREASSSMWRCVEGRVRSSCPRRTLSLIPHYVSALPDMENRNDEIAAKGSKKHAVMTPSVVLEAKSVNVALADDSQKSVNVALADDSQMLKTASESLSLWHNKASFVFLAIMLGLAAFQGAIFHLYTYVQGIGFTKTGRQYVWCFLCISIMYIGRVWYSVFYWKATATNLAKKVLNLGSHVDRHILI